MEDERNTFLLSADEIREAEELNSLSDTRMTDEYRQFLDEKLGEITEPVLPESDTDVDESGSYFEDETAERYASGFKSNMVESELQGSFSSGETETEESQDDFDT